MIYSAFIPIGGQVGSVTTLVTALPGSPTMTSNVGLLFAIGIEFYQLVNSVQNPMAGGNAMRLQNVF